MYFCPSCLCLDFYEENFGYKECCHCCAVVVSFSFRVYIVSSLARYARFLVGTDI